MIASVIFTCFIASIAIGAVHGIVKSKGAKTWIDRFEIMSVAVLKAIQIFLKLLNTILIELINLLDRTLFILQQDSTTASNFLSDTNDILCNTNQVNCAT